MTSYAIGLGVTSASRAAVPITPLSVPSGFGWTPSWTFSRIGAGGASTFKTSFDFDASKPTPNADLYVDSIAGNNANAGASRGAALRSLSSAITAGNALAVACVRLLVRPGDYWRYAGGSTLNDHFNAVAPTCNYIIEPDAFYGSGGVRIIGNHAAAVSYAVFSGAIYKSTASVGTSSGRTIVDLAHVDASGFPIGLKRVNGPANTANPAAEINAAWAEGHGAFYYNSANGDLFMRTVDDRAPDSNIVLCTGAASMFQVTGSATRKIWMDRLTHIGGDRCVAINCTGGASEFYARQNGFIGSGANNGGGGFSWVSSAGFAVLDRCAANDGLLDGFNYHGASVGGNNSPRALEIDCVSRRCGGALGGANNASTAHEDSKVICVNGLYESAQDRTVHDIANAQRWMLGSTINAPIDTTSASGLIRAGNGAADATQMWLDAVRFGAISGSQFHIDALAAATVHYATMSVAGLTTPGAGIVTAYAP